MRRILAAVWSVTLALGPWPGAATRACAAELELTDQMKADGAVLFKSSTTWQGRLAPPVSAAGDGALYLFSGDGQFRLSQDGGAYSRIQQRITGTCGVGQAITQVNPNGTVSCGNPMPSGIILLSTSSCPAGYEELLSMQGRFPVGTPNGGTVAETVGSPLGNLSAMSHTHPFTPSGSVAAPAFNGTAAATGAEAAHTHGLTPAGTLAWPGASAVFSGTPSTTGNTNLAHTHAGPAHAHNWPGAALGQDVSSNGAHTHNWPSAGLDTGNSTGHTHTLTATGSVSSSFTGATLGTALDAIFLSHNHANTGNGGGELAMNPGDETWAAGQGHAHTVSALITDTHGHAITVTGSVSSSFTGSAAATSGESATHTHNVAGLAGATDSSGGHLHTIAQYAASTDSSGTGATTGASVSLDHAHNFTPAGTVSWPASVPTFAGSAGSTGAGSAHSHSFTASGTVSAPAFSGTAGVTGSGDPTPPYIQVLFCLKQ